VSTDLFTYTAPPRRIPRGRISEETEIALDRKHQTISARYTDLRREGYIEYLLDAGGIPIKRNTRSGSSAYVHVVTPAGLQAIRLGFVQITNNRDPTVNRHGGNAMSATAFNKTNRNRNTDALEVLKDIAAAS
jgi:hypothetical protein